MIPPTAEINGWNMKQWALVFAHYREQFRGLDEAGRMQRRYQAEHGDPPLEPTVTTLDGSDHRPHDYPQAAKLYEALSLHRQNRARSLH